jgi:hypothetical protein
MDQIIKCLLLKNDTVLISEIVEVGSELGEPDCKLTNPFKLVKQSEVYTLEPWIDYTNQNEFMIHSDSILTIVDPTADLLSKYFEMIA